MAKEWILYIIITVGGIFVCPRLGVETPLGLAGVCIGMWDSVCALPLKLGNRSLINNVTILLRLSVLIHTYARTFICTQG